jgi:hypothetical protein
MPAADIKGEMHPVLDGLMRGVAEAKNQQPYDR